MSLKVIVHLSLFDRAHTTSSATTSLRYTVFSAVDAIWWW